MKFQKKETITFVAICIDSVLKVDKKNYPQVYLEQGKYKIKRRKPVDVIDAEVDLVQMIQIIWLISLND